MNDNDEIDNNVSADCTSTWRRSVFARYAGSAVEARWIELEADYHLLLLTISAKQKVNVFPFNRIPYNPIENEIMK